MQPRGQNDCLANGRLAHAYNSSTQSQPSISALGRCRQEKQTFETSSAGSDGGLKETLPQKTNKSSNSLKAFGGQRDGSGLERCLPLKPCDLSSVPRTHGKTQEPTPQVRTFRFLLTLPISHQVLTDKEKFTKAKQVSPKQTRRQSCAPLRGGQEGGVLAALVHPECKYSYNCCQVLVQVPMGAPGRKQLFCDIYCEHQLSRVPCFSTGSNSEPQSAHVVISHCFEGH